jgi:hypothetical protein
MRHPWESLAISCVCLLIAARATAQQGEPSSSCSTEALRQASDPASLRTIASNRIEIPNVSQAALSKLNGLSPPLSPTFKLQPPVSLELSEKVVYAFNVPFARLESYPSQLGFERLDEVIALLRSSHTILRISFTGGADSEERRLNSTNDIAKKRKDFVYLYFRAAGVDLHVPVGNPILGEDWNNGPPERAVEVEVESLRKQGTK